MRKGVECEQSLELSYNKKEKPSARGSIQSTRASAQSLPPIELVTLNEYFTV